ncbi:hypothetical protein [Embleya hyalina]|uniref:Uncharacterized protein n=1 Tax=Embleya hyalina TaxID=516124 RepID=A0A401YWT7_9ACTN|nr:hypothetical protein [Embleya hyalina]GCD99049.1 hypothetical protein EHYA_06761 [Embleya hyalina]
MTPDPVRYATAWFLAPARNQPWGLALDRVVVALETRSGAHWRLGEGLYGEPLVNLGFSIASWQFEGSCTPDPSSLSIRICDVHAAAEVLSTWFLGLLPSGVASVVFNSEDGVENGYGDVDFTLPCLRGREAIVDTLGNHLRHVWVNTQAIPGTGD